MKTTGRHFQRKYISLIIFMFEVIAIPLQHIYLVQENFKVSYLMLCKLINMITRIFLILSRIDENINI